MMKYILAFDTSTPETMIALIQAEEKFVLQAQLNLKTHSHGPVLLPSIQRLLADNEVDKSQLVAVAVGIGPGSFTGIRIGLATAKVIAWGLEIPLIALNTFEHLVDLCLRKQIKIPVICLLDARRNEVYSCVYSKAKYSSPNLLSNSKIFEFLEQFDQAVLAGSGARLHYEEILSKRGSCLKLSDLELSPSGLAHLAHQKYLNKDFSSVVGVKPLYIRLSDAEKNRKNKFSNSSNSK